MADSSVAGRVLDSKDSAELSGADQAGGNEESSDESRIQAVADSGVVGEVPDLTGSSIEPDDAKEASSGGESSVKVQVKVQVVMDALSGLYEFLPEAAREASCERNKGIPIKEGWELHSNLHIGSFGGELNELLDAMACFKKLSGVVLELQKRRVSYKILKEEISELLRKDVSSLNSGGLGWHMRSVRGKFDRCERCVWSCGDIVVGLEAGEGGLSPSDKARSFMRCDAEKLKRELKVLETSLGVELEALQRRHDRLLSTERDAKDSEKNMDNFISRVDMAAYAVSSSILSLTMLRQDITKADKINIWARGVLGFMRVIKPGMGSYLRMRFSGLGCDTGLFSTLLRDKSVCISSDLLRMDSSKAPFMDMPMTSKAREDLQNYRGDYVKGFKDAYGSSVLVDLSKLGNEALTCCSSERVGSIDKLFPLAALSDRKYSCRSRDVMFDKTPTAGNVFGCFIDMYDDKGLTGEGLTGGVFYNELWLMTCAIGLILQCMVCAELDESEKKLDEPALDDLKGRFLQAMGPLVGVFALCCICVTKGAHLEAKDLSWLDDLLSSILQRSQLHDCARVENGHLDSFSTGLQKDIRELVVEKHQSLLSKVSKTEGDFRVQDVLLDEVVSGCFEFGMSSSEPEIEGSSATQSDDPVSKLSGAVSDHPSVGPTTVLGPQQPHGDEVDKNPTSAPLGGVIGAESPLAWTERNEEPQNSLRQVQ